MSADTRSPLSIPSARILEGARLPAEIVADPQAVTEQFADDFINAYQAALQTGRRHVVFIVPVGPVGQFELIAERCNTEGISLRDLYIINMDEYLVDDGLEFIPTSDPLSFRRHMDEYFYGRLNPVLAPPRDRRIFPSPVEPHRVTALIEELGGVDACFGGVGITGHLAFNDPPRRIEAMGTEEFAALPTRVVRLSVETRVVNAITACGGNIDRIPKFAVTVGMKEILASRKVRIYMNRHWQTAIVRKVLHGPRTAAVPASLLQGHPDVRFTIAILVTHEPEPALR
jgi:glucosamine-6-phosphate deaminase